MIGRVFQNRKQPTSEFDAQVPWKVVSDLGPFVFIDYICKHGQGPADVKRMLDAIRPHPVILQPALIYSNNKAEKKQPLVKYYTKLGFKKLKTPGAFKYMVLK